MNDSPSDFDAEHSSGLKFYYNRERRLQNAPESVRNAWENGYVSKTKGFLHGLTGNPGSRSIFISIIVLSALVVALTLFDDGGSSVRSGDFEGKLKAFLHGESVFVTLTCTDGSGKLEELPVMVQGLDSASRIVSYAEVTGLWIDGKLIVRCVLTDYQTEKIRATFTVRGTELEVLVRVDRS